MIRDLILRLPKITVDLAEISGNILTAFRYAAQSGHVEVVRLLLAHPKVNPADWNNRGETHLFVTDPLVAIKRCAKYGRTEVVKILLTDSRVDPTVGNYRRKRFCLSLT